MHDRATIGIDIGGTYIKAGVLDPGDTLEHRRSIETEGSGGFEHVLMRIVALIDSLRTEAGLARSAETRVGIGVPGPMSHREGFIYGAPNLPGWVNIPLRDLLQKATGLSVSIENDANAAAFGEFAAGAGRGIADMVMLTLGTGIGGGVIMDGRLQRGHFDNAGEVGHMIVAIDGRACPCGQLGCLERYASANAVGERVVEAIRAGEASILAARVAGGKAVSSSDVAEAARGGDALAHRIWDDACRYLAAACVNLQHILNPQRIVLTGGMIGAGEQLFRAVRDHFTRLTWRVAKDQPEIVPATLGGDAGTIGAAALARRSDTTI